MRIIRGRSYITLSELASILGISREAIRQWRRSGVFGNHVVKIAKRYYISSEVAVFVSKLGIKPARDKVKELLIQLKQLQTIAKLYVPDYLIKAGLLIPSEYAIAKAERKE